MCWHHTETHVYTHISSLAFFFPLTRSDPRVRCFYILHMQHFPLLPLQDMCMSYEGIKEDVEGCVCVGVFGG